MKNIALVAHDGRKKELLEWVKYNITTLRKHKLYATGTDGLLVVGIMNHQEKILQISTRTR